MVRSILWTVLLAGIVVTPAASAAQAKPPSSAGVPPSSEKRGRPDRRQPGPWDSDVLVYRIAPDGTLEKLATFERAGVATVARMADGRLIAAHQHFPEDDDENFDKVAVHFSADEGRTWTEPRVIRVNGLPEGMRFPFDPTLVPLAAGRVRLYFTSMHGRRFEEDQPAIYSAVSTNGLDYVFEPGVRFGVEGRVVIDCAVVLHQGVFHLYAPDNGAVPRRRRGRRAERRRPEDRPREGVGYHATSRDGLTFVRADDVRIDGRRSWLGAAQSDGGKITFFGSGGPGGWVATSENGQEWTLSARPARIPCADPGAVRLKDHSWLVAGTGPPRPGTPSRRARRPGNRVEWIRAGVNTDRPAWGLRGGLQWGLPPPAGRPPDGPRGLIRVRYPVLRNGGYDVINFIAVEPIVRGRRGFSELERSQLDGVRGKRLWARDPGAPARPAAELPSGRLARFETGEESLTVHVGVERFQNGAHVRLTVIQRSGAPDELELIVHAEPDSAPIEYCILTATMGNKARARKLWLKDGTAGSLELYPDYRDFHFTPHRLFPLDRLRRTPAGEVLVCLTTDEADPAVVDPYPAASHWRYRGSPVMQYWKKPPGAWCDDLQVAVNARYTYWMSRHPIPGGVAFENFEMRERFYPGQRFVFGITRRNPEELGFDAGPAGRKSQTPGD